jgi:hypothetical protein
LEAEVMSDAEKMVEMCGPMEPGAEHESLKRFEGTWRAVVKLWPDPSAEPLVSEGTMKSEMILGGRFLEQVYSDDAGMFAGRGFWGYNTIDKRYEGFWIDSMGTFFQLERGEHDADEDAYMMSGEMTNPGDGKPMAKRSVIRYLGPDANSIEMYFKPGGAAAEAKAMEIQYQRA